MSRLRVVLLHAPSVYDFRKLCIMHGPVSDVVPSTPVFEMYPMGLTAISERLTHMGYDVWIHNLAYKMLADPGCDPEAEIAGMKKPFAFGIDLHWLPHCHGAIEVARICKKHHPSVPVVMGGIAASYFHQELIRYDCVDYVIRGDSSEVPFGDLLWNIEHGKPLDQIPNLTWIDVEGKLRINPLGHVPDGVFDTSNNYLHMFSQSVRHLSIRSAAPFLGWLSYPILAIMTCRGCTQGCIICGGSADGFRRYMGRKRIAMRPAESLILDIRRAARYTSAPIFIVGDLRQGGNGYARKVLEELEPYRIKNHVILEFFRRAEPGYVDLISKAFPNFNVQMSPETHDDGLRSRNGKPYTAEDLEASINLALERGCRKFDAYFMVGLAGQTKESVIRTAEYAEGLAERFDKRLNLFVSPLAPFLDPGSIAFEEAEKFGYKILFRDLESHRQALLAPSWKYTLNYETDSMSRDDIVEATYDAALRFNSFKGRLGHIDRQTFEITEKRIRLAIEVKREIDRIVEDLPEDQRAAAIEKIRDRVSEASASTICAKAEIKWPVLRRNFNIFEIGWDVIFGPTI